MLNNVVLLGRITHDLELRRTASGIAVCSFSVAVERDYKDAGGERVTDFFEVSAWRGLAELASKHFSKGQRVLIKGSLEQRKFTDKDGNNRSVVSVRAEDLYFVERRSDA